MNFDKTVNETYKHKQKVNELLNTIIGELLTRSVSHDNSKLETPEVEGFAEYIHKLSKLTYGSNEYKETLNEMKYFIDHHYKHNPHHPEYYENGIKDMSLIDLIEMICDWKAATLRHEDGDINKSIEINQKRFKYSDELKQIFINTLKYL